MTRKTTCEEANQTDMVKYLENMGFLPKLIRANDFWYLSPLRDEKSPSFKVNRLKNVWYDHGIGRGGTLVDFGILYYRCSVKEFLQKLTEENGVNISFHPQNEKVAGERKGGLQGTGKIIVLESHEITDQGLQKYIQARQIPLDIASEFCMEIRFELCGKKHLAIGFKNDLGGYELRSQSFKGSSSPKAPRLIAKTGSEELTVFEGFFNFLSFQTIQKKSLEQARRLPIIQSNFLVLNSLSFFEKSRERMEQCSRIHLFLDRDQMGIKSTQQALEWSSKYVDQSMYYKNCKDLNDYLTEHPGRELRQRPGKGMRI